MLLKNFSFVAILIACMLVSNAEAWLMRAVYHNSAYPGKCFVNENLILSPGQVAKSPDSCSEIHCENVKGHAQVMGCSKVADPENCKWDGLEDENAAFPLCCVEDFVCDSSADEEQAKKLQEELRDEFRRQVEAKHKH